MITWIAGWPHNGSTLVRQILKQCFDITVYSSYIEEKLAFLFGEDSVKFSERWVQDKLRCYIACIQDRGSWFIKTHEIAFDGSAAILVVRDGRDAVSALSRFWHIPVRDAITGQGCIFGNWSSYYYSWDWERRPHTLLLRFEDMAERPDEVVCKLERFLKMPAKRDFIDTFEQNKEHYPKLFNDKHSCWQDRMTEGEIELFWNCHGHLMKALGYGRQGPGRQIITNTKEM